MFYGCPISIEVADACYAARVTHFVCSTSQVGPNAYSGFTHDEFAAWRHGKDIFAERDHLGRKAGEDIKWWLERDLGIMDGCHLHTFRPEEAVPWIEQYKYEFQLGPGEDTSEDIDPALFDLPCKWISFPQGPLITNLANTGVIRGLIIDSHRKHGKLIRAHNCDYLPLHKIAEICDFVDGYNIAPQFGTLQSAFYYSTALLHGLPIRDWQAACQADDINRQRWGYHEPAVLACGHYHFNRLEWRAAFRTECTEHLTKCISALKNAGARN